MQFFRRVWDDIVHGENIDLYLTIIVAVVVGLLALFDVATDQVSSLTLAVLALIAFSNLQNRHQNELLIEKLDASSRTTISLDDIFEQDAPKLANRLRTAKNIAHNGMTLVGTSNSLLSVFADCMANGGHIRLLTIDADSPAIAVAATRFRKHQDTELLKREAMHALDNFQYLIDLSDNNFDIRLSASVPPYSIWIIDAGLPTAEIWVGLYPYRAYLEPWLQVSPTKDKAMYAFFNEQFELMWQASKQADESAT